jgi:outer membrane protein assembly factor BamB
MAKHSYSLSKMKILRAGIVILALFLFCCQQSKDNGPKEFHSWDKLIGQIGTFSSPRAVDLTGDGIQDIVLGAGKVEFQYTDSAVVALNGADGSLLWTTAARDQIFGSPSFMDITSDGIPDVFIGGRSAEFMAINGHTGEIIWEFFPSGDTVDFTVHKVYNFYNPQFIRDCNGDGINDILVANGGYVKALPTDPDRPPGKLMVINARTGTLVSEAYMPDHKETYMSCVVFNPQDENPKVIFGSGGERIPGNLYITFLQDILKGDLSNATILAKGGSKGFVAPPVLADITGDEIPDIIANAVDGKMIAIDGSTYKLLWELTLSGTEAYCSIAVGHYDKDSIPDFFTNFGIGTFPDLLRSYQLAVSGKDGRLIRLDSLGSFHYGSPVAYDIDGDGLDEAFYHINHYNLGMVKNSLTVFNFSRDTVYDFYPQWMGANVASTPLLTDLDDDGYIEIVCVHENNPADLFSKEYKTGLVIHTLKTSIAISTPIKWGSYMGSFYDGMYHSKQYE